ncbi:MAG: serine protease [Rubrobacteraceae bacterium]
MKVYNKLPGISLWLAFALFLALLLVSFVSGPGGSARADEEPTMEGQVIGGTGVRNGEYPFVTALLDKSYGNSAYRQQFCGGTLIDPDSVLTAAHCVSGTRSGHLRVTVGRTALKSNQGVIRNVTRVFVHPKYSDRSSKHDAAVLKLKGSVENVEPVRIPGTKQNSLERKGTKVTVAGWGNTIAQPVSGPGPSNYPNRMRKAWVPVRTDNYGKLVYGPSYNSRLMIAAGKTGKDTCQGDSGGPLFKKSGGEYYQVGVTSFGYGCGAPGHPGVYTEVNAPSVRSFIMKSARN